MWNDTKTIEVESWLGGNAGDIQLATDDSEKRMSLYVNVRYALANVHACLTLSPKKARALRDALIEAYPISPTLPKVSYEYGSHGGQPAVYEVTTDLSNFRRKVAEFSTETDAHVFIDAKTKASS